MLRVRGAWKALTLLLVIISFAREQRASHAFKQFYATAHLFDQPDPIPALLGVDLGFSYITSAYIGESGPIIASRFEAPEVYKQMMRATINGTADQFCGNDTEQGSMKGMLTSILQQALAESRQREDESLHIGMLVIPEFIGEGRNKICYRQISNAFNAVSHKPVFLGPHIRKQRVSAITFPSNDCYDHYTMSKSGDDEFLVVMVEVAYSTFKVAIVELSIPGPIIINMAEYNVSTTSWSAVDRDELRAGVLRLFQEYKAGDVRSVLFMAEHSPNENDKAAIKNIIETLDEAVPGLAAKVHDFGSGIEHRHAIGAACFAKDLAQHPFNPCRDIHVECNPNERHDEL